MIHTIKIGDVELENNVFLAPMAGITDKAFRKIVKEYGAGLTYTEMASAKALYYQDKKTEKLINTEAEKRPIAVQIFGSEPKIMAEAVRKLEREADIIDINAGCPAPKVVKNGDGSKLLLNVELLGEIVEQVKKATTKPVTVKIRTGWDEEHIVAVQAAKIIEQAGASAITVHGRTREQFYSGKADWNIIKEVKQSVKIPVIGNGDIENLEDAKKMFETTGVDAIMIGRGSLGNPWIFRSILQEKEQSVSGKERWETIQKHIELAIEDKGERNAIKEMRKHLAWYLKNLKNAAKIRDKMNQLETKKDVIDCLSEYFETIGIV